MRYFVVFTLILHNYASRKSVAQQLEMNCRTWLAPYRQHYIIVMGIIIIIINFEKFDDGACSMDRD